MNLLIDLVPNLVVIDGIEYKINSDFRISILFELLMQDVEISDDEKAILALDLYYPICPNNQEMALEKLLWFYKCGKEIEDTNSKGIGGGNAEQIYSFEYDDEYIYSAFLDQYGVDLQDIEYLHWWKFKAMFKALKEDNEIVKIMGYRALDLSKIDDKNQKEHYRKLKQMYKIPDAISQSDKEKLDKINEILLTGGDISELL